MKYIKFLMKGEGLEREKHKGERNKNHTVIQLGKMKKEKVRWKEKNPHSKSNSFLFLLVV